MAAAAPSHLRRFPSVVRRSLDLVRDAARAELRAVAVLQVLGAILLGAQLAVLAAVVSELTEPGGPSLAGTAPELAGFVALSLATAALSFAAAERRWLAAAKTSIHVQDHVLAAAAAAPYADFERPAFLDALQRLVHDAEHQPYSLISGLVSLGTSLLTLATLAVAIVLTAPVLLVVVAAGALPLVLVVAGNGRATFRTEVDLAPVDRERLAITQVVVGRVEAPELHATGSAGYLVERVRRLGIRRITMLDELRRVRERRHVAAGTTLSLGLGLALACLVWLIDRGDVSLGAAGALAFGLQQFGGQLRSAVVGVGSLYESSLFTDEVVSFLAEHDAPATTRDPSAGAALAPLSRLSVRDVSFTYPGADHAVLSDVTLELTPGRVVALVGANGAGKTTLVKLLCGLLTPTSGEIEWNGTAIAHLDQVALRGRVAVLFQSFVRYELSASDNIGLGAPERLDDRPGIEAAASWAGAHPLLADLPNGYDTLLTPSYEGGVDLSGGQWQQVALARAAFRDADLLILDEPTAALDPVREREVFEWLRREAADRAVLLVSHRYTTVRSADHVIVLAGGRIVEEGDPSVLLRADGAFSDLYRHDQ